MGCSNISNSAIYELSFFCKELTSLNLQLCVSITDDAIVSLSKYAKNLINLNLSDCNLISDVSLNALGGDSSIDMFGCPMLRVLEVAKCSLITDSGITSLARGCHELEKLDLEDCSLLTDASLSILSCHSPRLQALLLGHCELISDSGMRHLVSSKMELLQDLAVDNCPLITDVSLGIFLLFLLLLMIVSELRPY